MTLKGEVMKKSAEQGFEPQYRLYRRFLALVDSVMTLGDALRHVGYVRYKPLFSTYKSCIEVFKEHYAKEYEKLELEDLPLYDDHGQSLFTANKLSTLLHQAQTIIGFLEGELPPELLAQKDGSTIVNVSSQADSQAMANSVAQLQARITLDSLYQVVQDTDFDRQIKDELLRDIKELKESGQEPNQSKLRSFATKFVKKLQEIGENSASEVIYKLLSSKMGEM